jgi:uncharacterized protein (DUF305 family)
MKIRTTLWLPALLVAASLLLSSCGGAGGGEGGDDGTQSTGHGGSRGGETSRQGTQQETTSGSSTGMGHDRMENGSMGMGSERMARQMVMENGQYSDERFIDMMVPHHQGAIEMARIALENAEHKGIRELSRNILSSQQAEIEELKAIKQEEFGTSNVPMEMTSEQMQGMGMTDPQRLANQEPFDKAFIDAMIPHHKSAIAMASVALEESDNVRIKEMAGAIVEAQEREIAQMRAWRREWCPED